MEDITATEKDMVALKAEKDKFLVLLVNYI